MARTINFNFPITLSAYGLFTVTKELTFTGGPFPTVAGADFSVCLKAEASTKEIHDASMHIPIRDFSVPTDEMRGLVESAVLTGMLASLHGESVGVGCMGGIGRTGLIMAIAAKAAGVKDPISYVRANFKSHAVETKQQEEYVRNFDTSEITRCLAGEGKALFWETVRQKVKSFFGVKVPS